MGLSKLCSFLSEALLSLFPTGVADEGVVDDIIVATGTADCVAINEFGTDIAVAEDISEVSIFNKGVTNLRCRLNHEISSVGNFVLCVTKLLGNTEPATSSVTRPGLTLYLSVDPF